MTDNTIVQGVVNSFRNWIVAPAMMFLPALLALFVGCDALAVQQQVLLDDEPSISARKPNFLFILTDDQDLRMNSPAYMPYTQARIKEKGTEFLNHFVTTALCCPSRVSLWTGRQAHNTNVTDVNPPYGMLTFSIRHDSSVRDC